MKKLKIFSIFVLFFCLNTVSTQRRCTPINGNRINCISVRECPSVLEALQVRPLSPEVTNYLRLLQCGFEGFNPLVCCPPTIEINRPRPVPRPRPTSTTARPTPSIPLTPSGGGSLATYSECGIEAATDKIYNGEITEIDEFPWMVLLGYRRRNGSISYQCGGSLINKRYILTAAHCVKGAIETEVGPLASIRIGEYHTQTNPDCVETSGGEQDCNELLQEITPEEIIPHSGYVDGETSRRHDIALIRLSREAQYNYFVAPVCIANSTLRIDTGDDVYVAGWGRTESGRRSDVKLKLKMPLFDHNRCVELFGEIRANITNRQICAGGEFYKDSCNGDSGGPLMQHVNDRWYAIGVVSFGRACGMDGWPGVYTSTLSYRNWMLENMRP